MEEIKVGEFIRSNDGYIGKIIEIRKTKRDCDTYYCTDKTMASGFYEHIKKHSENLIDLIEEGDYVNGVEVIDLADGIHFKFANDVSFVDVGLCTYMDGHVEGIETIVTKEQMKSIEYVVKE